jgi:hypothetical protein
MSDDELRRLERRWRDTGSQADEVAYLHARLRAGELDPQRLALAAYVGWGAAHATCGQAPQALEDDGPANAWRFVEGLQSRWGDEATLRCVAAVARLILDWEPRTKPPPALDEGLTRCADAVEALLLCPCDEHEQACYDAGNAYEQREWNADTLPWRFLDSIAWCGWNRSTLHAEDQVLRAGMRWKGTAAVLAAIRAEVGSWALGWDDPVTRRQAGPPRQRVRLYVPGSEHDPRPEVQAARSEAGRVTRELVISAPRSDGARVLSFAHDGVRMLLPPQVVASLGTDPGRLAGSWRSVPETADWVSDAPRVRHRIVSEVPARWHPHFGADPVALEGGGGHLGLSLTEVEDMGFSAWAWGLRVSLDVGARSFEILEDVDTE